MQEKNDLQEFDLDDILTEFQDVPAEVVNFLKKRQGFYSLPLCFKLSLYSLSQIESNAPTS